MNATKFVREPRMVKMKNGGYKKDYNHYIKMEQHRDGSWQEINGILSKRDLYTCLLQIGAVILALTLLHIAL